MWIAKFSAKEFFVFWHPTKQKKSQQIRFFSLFISFYFFKFAVRFFFQLYFITEWTCHCSLFAGISKGIIYIDIHMVWFLVLNALSPFDSFFVLFCTDIPNVYSSLKHCQAFKNIWLVFVFLSGWTGFTMKRSTKWVEQKCREH